MNECLVALIPKPVKPHLHNMAQLTELDPHATIKFDLVCLEAFAVRASDTQQHQQTWQRRELPRKPEWSPNGIATHAPHVFASDGFLRVFGAGQLAQERLGLRQPSAPPIHGKYHKGARDHEASPGQVNSLLRSGGHERHSIRSTPMWCPQQPETKPAAVNCIWHK